MRSFGNVTIENFPFVASMHATPPPASNAMSVVPGTQFKNGTETPTEKVAWYQRIFVIAEGFLEGPEKRTSAKR